MAYTWDEAIQIVLREAGEALHYTEITDRIIARALRNEEAIGATPAQTVNATINSSLNRPNSPYVRVRAGEFALRSELSIESAPAPAQDIEDAPTGALKAFGMYWRRELVIWSRGARLLVDKAGVPQT
jgi:hypothetical protein